MDYLEYLDSRLPLNYQYFPKVSGAASGRSSRPDTKGTTTETFMLLKNQGIEENKIVRENVILNDT